MRERDFTTVSAMAHDEGISYNRIAEACALKSERVSQIARGAAAVTALATVERISGGLRIPGALLGLAAQPWEDTAALGTESDHGDDSMKRRNMLRGALPAGLTAPALAALTAARTDVDQTPKRTPRLGRRTFPSGRPRDPLVLKNHRRGPHQLPPSHTVLGGSPVIFFAVLQEGRWPPGPA
ncbi:hypothetical protein [Streptomyces sp. AC550_RSS872]|uniref:hypothetical protein n=1 Tax=Streptomyces sp. AC550_RSS872 TaxID=2823689 RepID=UPI001C254F2E|nr:hypothetical protein [Streptomyces sp. AC550_RSS872]